MPDPKPYRKTILCLASSWRPGGSCFAGKEVVNGVAGAWIRPINSAHSNAISDHDRRCEGGALADVLDIVNIPMREPRPKDHHREDHQILAGQCWRKVGRATWRQVLAATDTVAGPLWPNERSSSNGLNDKVSEATAIKQSGSLLLIAPTRLDLVVGAEPKYDGSTKRVIRADFDFNGEKYNFVVTDPWIRDKYLAGSDGIYPVEKSRLCVSLPGVINSFSYKLVAAVITPERAG